LRNRFVEFLIEKAQKLSDKTQQEVPGIHERDENCLLIITENMMQEAMAKLKRKKSYGIDGIPLCVL